ncbi:unnamed protein product [Leptosia nina]|uniref:Protein FAM114A2 n=1 Tax=Leptosia nina TaxID=320188 RepID=A0AAV1IZB7_9NEOP
MSKQSDSEDFESADEGQTLQTKKEKKEIKKLAASTKNVEQTDGWDDFDIEETEAVEISKSNKKDETEKPTSQDTGWEAFDDWGENDNNKVEEVKPNTKSTKDVHKSQEQADIQAVTERLAAATTKNEGWGWGGWGVDSLLSTATAGISTLTSQVSQGISTVLETGIGAPDPEELARATKEKAVNQETNVEEQPTAQDTTFQFGSLLSGVTKFVETTGTKVISGGLDTLEVIGKKTMEVLQDGDPGLVKKRAMLGLDTEKPILSQILREAKERADEEDKMREAKREAKEVHYETLFDDFEGLVHLEALEMLSRQVSMRIEERLRSADADKRQDIKETMQQVAELCEMPEDDDDDDDDEEHGDSSKEDVFHERLQRATRDIGLKLQFQPLIKQYTDILQWLDATEVVNEKAIYKRAVSGLAQATALCVELYHKTAEMLLVKNRRSTADEADALTQLTVVLSKHVSEMATLFTEKLSKQPSEDKELINNYITNVFLEAGNSSKYVENAFQLTLPIIQIGAV